MLNNGEIHALVSLLDDDDEEVVQHVNDKLISMGADVIPVLEGEWANLTNQHQQKKVEQIIHRIQYSKLLLDLKQWYDEGQEDLLTGVLLIARYRYPDLDPQNIMNQIDKMRLEIWLEMHYDLSPYEKVRIINHVLYTIFGFKGNTDNYHAPENSFINDVIQNRKGNPIMLAVIYILIAQRLHLPVFGVNLPQHFVCAYKEEQHQAGLNDPFNLKTQLNYKDGRVLFYINAFNNGAVFSRANLEQFLRQLRIDQQPGFFEACSNLDIIKRIMRNLVVAYEKSEHPEKANDIKQMLLVLGEEYFSYDEEAPSGEEDF
ncbi:MAG: transglutaminase family protein [Bacteroidota bacterium]|jgi:regulator of sirC expression with transglutaminase-like and TPR domain